MIFSRYGSIKECAYLLGLSHSKFKRYTGVSKFVFNLMVLVVEQWKKDHQKKEGRPNKLSFPDRMLLLLEYYREYRTFFHRGLSRF